MTRHTNSKVNSSRRQCLKTLALGAASIASPLAVANIVQEKAVTTNISTLTPECTILPACNITIYRQQVQSREVVSMMNLSDKAITINNLLPTGLFREDGKISVSLNLDAMPITLQPGDRFAFEIEARSLQLEDPDNDVPNVLSGYIDVISDHPSMHGIIPVTIFDNQVA